MNMQYAQWYANIVYYDIPSSAYMQDTTGLLICNIIRTMPTCHSPDSADKFCVGVLWSAPRYDTQHLTTPVVLQRRWATWSAKTWVWLTTTLVLALLKLWFPEEWHLLYCSCCVTILARCSRTQLRASESKSIRMNDMSQHASIWQFYLRYK